MLIIRGDSGLAGLCATSRLAVVVLFANVRAGFRGFLRSTSFHSGSTGTRGTGSHVGSCGVLVSVVTPELQAFEYELRVAGPESDVRGLITDVAVEDVDCTGLLGYMYSYAISELPP